MPKGVYARKLNTQFRAGSIVGRLQLLELRRALVGRKIVFRHRAWLCRCDCGNVRQILENALARGTSQSCGCLSRELLAKRSRTHGMTKTPTHRSWANMIKRCTVPSANRFKHYGGRGIRVCRRWRQSFQLFLSDMGERPSLANQIERIDNDGDYEPGNCRWATIREQARNRSTNRMLTFNGETLCLTDWANKVGLSVGALSLRIVRRGWSVERALTTPLLGKKRDAA